ncbi:Aminopeptidase 1 [Pseudocercospora fuligena]|uniref:Aminopeptidase n=1 Tax=Pseudocercospora fuligena TaxID=685502 RepID=A0A8H6RD11_9PEZI|nr:Aminopeptidase 1 [Pseudocercospora fuligena]
MTAVEPESRRLPQGIKPVHYSIQLFDIHLTEDDWAYHGSVDIDLVVKRATNKIILNAHNLRNVSATISGASEATVKSVSMDEDVQRLNVFLDRDLAVAEAPVSLSLIYEATIDGHLTGFYRSRESNFETREPESETENYVLTTQFQPSDARRAFPCWDEPEFKATFDLCMEVPNDLKVISNMPEKTSRSSERDAKRKLVAFEWTPIMSTYLLAWGIGKLECIETVISRKLNDTPLPIRVWAPPSSLQHGKFALRFAGQVITYFSEIFGIDYPLPKLDLLAVTEMSDDAMENCGLVIFRSTALSLDEEATSLEARTRVAYIIAHELAHQWFGNLVTMTWWDELWLNEGFATWAGWDACAHIYPDWDVWGQFVADDMQEALELDALPSSHPVQVPVLDGLEVDSIFDSISYLKGASIVRMLIGYLGRDPFLLGLSDYLSTNMYQSATGESLWAALQKASGTDVASLIEAWIKTMGFPIVSAQLLDNGTLSVKQMPALASANDTLWTVPLTMQTANGTRKALLEAPSSHINIDGSLIKMNVEQQGFYRSQIDIEALLQPSVSFHNLSTRDKAGLLGDTMALAFNGLDTPTSTVLDLCKKMSENADFVVWTSILACLDKISSTFSADEEISDGLEEFELNLISSQAHSLGWTPSPNESYSTQRLRPLLLTTAGLDGDEEVVTKASELFNSIQEGHDTDLHPSLREPVFKIVVGSEFGLDATTFLMKLYSTTHSPHERESIAKAMGQTSEFDSARELLHSIFSNQIFAAQDLETFAVEMAENSAVPGVVWDFIKEEWELVCDRLAGSMAIFEPFLRSCLQTLTSIEDAEELEEFFSDKDTLGYQRGLTVALDFIRANARFKERAGEEVREWLRSNGFIATTPDTPSDE